MKFSQYTLKNSAEALKDLKSSREGLSEEEAGKRLESFGFNEIKAKEPGLFFIFLKQFKSPFVYLLFLASIIAFLINERVNGIIILVFVLINIFLGFLQEGRAHRAITLLRKYFPSQVRILRKGKEEVVDKRFLVPGDIVLLNYGDVAPADLRIIRSENLLVDEEVLTGESVSLSKTAEPLVVEAKEIFEAKNIVFAGTAIISGKVKGLVISTGEKTALGEVTKLVSTITKESSYEKDLLYFSRLILRIVIVTIVVIFLANFFIKGNHEPFDFLLFCIALVVAILPETLPLIATFSFSSGALKLAKEKVVVKRLAAVGDLGNIEILCSDKTGTLTENKLELEEVHSFDEEKCLFYGLLASSTSYKQLKSSLDPFDVALFEKATLGTHYQLEKFKTMTEIPFDPSRLRSGAVVQGKGSKLLIVKGAPEVIFGLSSNFSGEDPRIIRREIARDGEKGRRTLAVAYKEVKDEVYEERDLTFLGYFSFIDPLKESSKESIRLAKELGVKVKIITGDSPEVSGQVAKEIGLVENEKEVILGEVINNLTEVDLEKYCQDYSVFARVSPQVKYKIVKKLSEKYEVGFLGEGINDAPALKAAHVAIVVPSAADVAREISDIILLEKDLNVIVRGIKQGRSIFSNIDKYIRCTIASNFGNFYSIALLSLLMPFLPMLPVQILLVNLLSDLPLVSVVTDSVDSRELRRPKTYRLNKYLALILLMGGISAIFDFIFFAIFYRADQVTLQTLWYLMSILTEIVFIFSIRTSYFFLKANKPSFPLVVTSFLAFVITIVLPFTSFGQKMFHFTSLPSRNLFIVLGLTFTYFVVSEIAKLIYYRYQTEMLV